MKSYTDIEQSKKLAEILPIESADMYYFLDPTPAGNIYHIVIPQIDFGVRTREPEYNEGDIPCWSLAALMNLLPSEFTEVGKYSTTTYKIDIRKYKFTDDVDLYQIAYGNYKFYEDGNSSWKDMINTGQKENLIDASFQMVCLLKENGKL